MDNYTPDKSVAFNKTLELLSRGQSGQSVNLGYIEFDDQGELWRMQDKDGGATQFSIVLNDLRQKLAVKRSRVIVYIHGWNNSASLKNQESGNLHDFRNTLISMGRHSDTPIYGVYIAWRGGTLPFVTGFDVWDRDATASRVGGPTMLAVLRGISSAAHENQRNPSSVIMVGHSFGGKILTQATSRHLAGEIGAALGSGRSTVEPLADSVVVINSATNGQEMRQIKELMRVHRITYRSRNLDVPLFVNIASETDHFVHYLLPVFQRYNRDVVAFPERGGHVANQAESDTLYSAMGHNPAFINFAFNDIPRIYPKIPWKGSESFGPAIHHNFSNGRNADSQGFNLWMQTNSEPTSGKNFKVDPINRESDGYQSPIWGLRVPAFIVPAHGGFWQPNFVGIIAALDGMTKPPTEQRGLPSKPALTIQRSILKAAAE
jgi:pimeloyl-ACP methyl ester carboxylesterase